MTVYRAEASPTKRGTIEAILRALQAPEWAAPNLDALADVLRDLSWLPQGPAELHWQVSSALPSDTKSAITDVLSTAQRQTAAGPRPFRLTTTVQ
jgi:hypothetical protein